jgi:hypothetical protein
MKQQIFIDDEYQYDYENNGELHTLYYSKNEYWFTDIRGSISMEIQDSGNGLSIKTDFSKKLIDYSQASELFILLKLINEPSKIEIATKVLL